MEPAAANHAGHRNSILDAVARLFETISIVCLAAVAVLIFLQIILRNVLSMAFASIEELARFAHITLVFFLVPLLFRENLHVNIDLLPQSVGPTARRRLGALSAFLTAVYGAFFLIGEYQFMLKNGSVPTPALGLANLFFFSGAYIGMALLLLVACEKLLDELRPRP